MSSDPFFRPFNFNAKLQSPVILKIKKIIVLNHERLQLMMQTLLIFKC
jgi:hypothetical protein